MTEVHRDSGGWSSASIYDPPEEVYVLSYCWQSGSASSGERVFFFDLQAALRYLDQVERDGRRLATDRPVVLQVARLDPRAWEHVLLQKPEGWRVAEVRKDELVECPECHGPGSVATINCGRCLGEGVVPKSTLRTMGSRGPVDEQGGLGPRPGGPR